MRNPCSQHVTGSIASTMAKLESGVLYRIQIMSLHSQRKKKPSKNNTQQNFTCFLFTAEKYSRSIL